MASRSALRAKTTLPTILRSAPAPDAVANVAKALGHPVRVRIVQLLLKNGVCIGCDIVDEVGLAQSTVSEHLRILKASGIIVGEIERPRICYSLNPRSLEPLTGLLKSIADAAEFGRIGGSADCPDGTTC
jgi:ArsR family transcriptional regulator